MRSSPFSNAKARARPLPAGEARREGAPFRCLLTFLLNKPTSHDSGAHGGTPARDHALGSAFAPFCRWMRW